jgi:hypothetical protein
LTAPPLVTSHRRVALALSLAAAGCAAMDDVDSHSIGTGTAGPVQPGNPPPSAVECAQACDRLFGGVAGDSAPDGFFEDENEDENDCFERCEAGGLDSLLDCILEVPAGAVTRVCFGGEGEDRR